LCYEKQDAKVECLKYLANFFHNEGLQTCLICRDATECKRFMYFVESGNSSTQELPVWAYVIPRPWKVASCLLKCYHLCCLPIWYRCCSELALEYSLERKWLLCQPLLWTDYIYIPPHTLGFLICGEFSIENKYVFVYCTGFFLSNVYFC